MSNSKRVAKLFGGALAAGAMFGFASQAQAGFTLDLRAPGANPKVAKVAAVGDKVTLDLYGIISATNAVASDEIHFAYFTASTNTPAGGIKGGLGVTILPEFMGTSAKVGKPWDLNADGVIDLIGDNPAASSSANWNFARFTTTPDGVVVTKGLEQKIGTVTFTVADLATKGATMVGLAGRKKTTLAPSAEWTEGGAVKTPATNTTPTLGDSVAIVFGGGPTTFLKYEAAGDGALGTVVVKGSAYGYKSNVLNVTPDAASGSVAVDIQGAGPNGPVFAMLWFANDPGTILADVGAQVITSGQVYDELHAANSIYTKAAGKAFDALVKFDGPLADNTFVNFNLGNAQIDKIAIVPEPASITLLGLGALGLLARRRRA